MFATVSLHLLLYWPIYTVSGKKGATLFLLCEMLTDFQNSFTVTLCSKFAVK